jgi:hypothetical protein
MTTDEGNVYKWGLVIAVGIALVFGGMKHGFVQAALLATAGCLLPWVPMALAPRSLGERASA